MTAHASAFFAPELFKGRVVAVTGGGSGINLGIADTKLRQLS